MKWYHQSFKPPTEFVISVSERTPWIEIALALVSRLRVYKEEEEDDDDDRITMSSMRHGLRCAQDDSSRTRCAPGKRKRLETAGNGGKLT
jgi:hypothetical protein